MIDTILTCRHCDRHVAPSDDALEDTDCGEVHTACAIESGELADRICIACAKLQPHEIESHRRLCDACLDARIMDARDRRAEASMRRHARRLAIRIVREMSPAILSSRECEMLRSIARVESTRGRAFVGNGDGITRARRLARLELIEQVHEWNGPRASAYYRTTALGRIVLGVAEQRAVA